MHPDDRARIQGLRDEVWSTGARYRSEYRMFRRDGEEVWVRDSSVLVISDQGHRLAWQGVIEDITTERRPRRRSEYRKPAIELSSIACRPSCTRWGRTTSAERCS